MHLSFEYVNFLTKMADYHETDDFIFCHTSIYSHLPMNQQDNYSLRRQKLEANHLSHVSGKTVICGHAE